MTTVGRGSFSLRPYQTEALASVKSLIDKGIRRVLVALPTGTGKTVVFAHLPSVLDLGNKRLLVLAHRGELLDQAAEKLRLINPGLTVEIEQAHRHAGNATVVVASVQTLRGKRLAALDPSEFGGIVIDEAHHATANTYRAITAHFGADHAETEIPVIGFTATPRRGDGVGLSLVFDEIAYDAPMLQMILDGHLARITGMRLDTHADISNVATRAGEFVTSQLAAAIDTEARNELIVSGWTELTMERKKTVAFCITVDHAQRLANAFALAGASTGVIHGAMPAEHRSDVLRRFGAGELDVLTNCMVLTEGYDEPGIDCIILARPTKSALLYTQMIGRGTRPAPGKDDCLILDCADNSGRHDLVSVSTLFGLPPQLDLEGQDAIEVSEQFEIEESRHPWIDYSKVRTLEELGAAATRIDFFASAVPAALQAWTTYQWIPISDGGYKLPMPKQEAVIVRPTRLDTFKAAYVRPGVEKKTRDWTKIGEFDTLREAIQAGDRAVSEFQEDATKLLDTRARWRSGSASEKQIALIKRMGIAVPEGITKGQAATVLTLTFNRKRSR